MKGLGKQSNFVQVVELMALKRMEAIKTMISNRMAIFINRFSCLARILFTPLITSFWISKASKVKIVISTSGVDAVLICSNVVDVIVVIINTCLFLRITFLDSESIQVVVWRSRRGSQHALVKRKRLACSAHPGELGRALDAAPPQV